MLLGSVRDFQRRSSEGSARMGALLSIVVVFFSAIAPAQQAAKKDTTPDHLIFCSYNLKNWLTMDRFDGQKTIPGAPKPADEKAAVIAILNAIHPDVLGVCEIGGEDDVRDLQQRLRAKGLALDHVATAHGGDATRKLALLSRFPIIARNSQTDLKYSIGQLVLPMQRGILDATVEITDTFQLRFLGVHLKSMRTIPEADQALMRRNEAHLVRKHIDGIQAAAPAANIVLYGDFNEHRNEPAIDEIIGSRAGDGLMTEVKVWDIDGEVWTHFWDAADSYSRLDYFFISKPLRPHVDFGNSFVYSKREFYKASDHRPIVMRLNVKSQTTSSN